MLQVNRCYERRESMTKDKVCEWFENKKSGWFETQCGMVTDDPYKSRVTKYPICEFCEKKIKVVKS